MKITYGDFSTEDIRKLIRQHGHTDWWQPGRIIKVKCGNHIIYLTRGELKNIACDDIVLISYNNGNQDLVCIESDYYLNLIAPQLTARAYKNAIAKANKKFWWKNLLGIK
jgi:hypothetical protein